MRKLQTTISLEISLVSKLYEKYGDNVSLSNVITRLLKKDLEDTPKNKK